MPNANDSPTAALFDDASENRPDPFDMFSHWLDAAKNSEINDANAMALATVDSAGMPNVRMVLLNGLSADGFVFFTNTQSAKGEELAGQPRAALLFHWKSVRRQVRVRGSVKPVSPSGADAYFATRARGSQVGAHASRQSQPLASRAKLVDAAAKVEAKFENKDVPRPPYWSGYLIVPEQIEFWQDGEFRLHDRMQFHRASPDNDWSSQRLYP